MDLLDTPVSDLHKKNADIFTYLKGVLVNISQALAVK